MHDPATYCWILRCRWRRGGRGLPGQRRLGTRCTRSVQAVGLGSDGVPAGRPVAADATLTAIDVARAAARVRVSALPTKEAPVGLSYEGRQVVGTDLYTGGGP